MHKIVTTVDEYNAIIFNPDLVITEVKALDPDLVVFLVVYENADGSSGVENFRTNIIIASFITMYARIKLWNLLFKVSSHKDAELLYFDTVSFLMIITQFIE